METHGILGTTSKLQFRLGTMIRLAPSTCCEKSWKENKYSNIVMSGPGGIT